MARVGAIVVTASARTSAFRKKLRGAGKSIRRFNAIAKAATIRMARMGVAMAKMGAGFALAGVGGLALLTRHSMKNIDILAKNADKLNMNTKALAGYQLAAQLTGTEVKSLHKGLTNMTKVISEAEKGLGIGLRAFKDLRLEAKDLVSLRPEDAFARIADAMQNVKNHTTKLRIAYELFGGRGTMLLNMLKLGGEGLKEVTARAEKYGLAISRIDAKRIEEANDAIHQAKQLFVGLGNVIAVNLADPIRDLAQRFIDWGTDSGGAAARVETAMTRITGWAAALADTIQGVSGLFVLMGESAIIGFDTARITAMRFFELSAKGISGFLDLFPTPSKGYGGYAVPGPGGSTTPVKPTIEPPPGPKWLVGSREAGGFAKLKERVAIWAKAFEGVGKEQETALAESLAAMQIRLDKFNSETRWGDRFKNWLKDIADAGKDAADQLLTTTNVAGALGARVSSISALGPRFAQAYETDTAASYRQTQRAEWGAMRDPTTKAVESMHDTLERVMREQQRATQELRAIKEGQAQTITMD